VSYAVRNTGQNRIPGLGVWVWNTLRPGPGDETTPRYCRLTPTIAGLRRTTEWIFRKDLAAAWLAAVEPDAREIFGATLEPESLHAVYFWVRSAQYPTSEWMTPALPLEPGTEARVRFSLVAVHGLDLVTHLCEDFAIKTWRERDALVSEIVFLDPAVREFRVITRLESAAGGLVEEAVGQGAATGDLGVVRLAQPLKAAASAHTGLVLRQRVEARGRALGEYATVLLDDPNPEAVPVLKGDPRAAAVLAGKGPLTPLAGEPTLVVTPLAGWTPIRKDVPFLEPADADRERGLILFRKGLMRDINSTFRPLQGERLDRVRLRLARGEVEMEDVILYALRPGPVEVSLDLPGLRARVLREDERPMYLGAYNLGMKPHLVSELLVPDGRADLEAGASRRFWIEAEAAADTPPGDYAGVVRVAFGGRVLTIPVQASVIPARLLSHPTRRFGTFVRAGLEDRDLRRNIFRDLKRHGRDVVVARVPGLGLTYDKDADRLGVDFRGLDEFVQDLREAGMSGPIIFNPPKGLEQVVRCAPDDERYVRCFQQMVRQIEDYQLLNSTPRLLWHPFDEQATYEPMATVTRRIKEACLTAMTLHTVVNAEVARQWKHLDVWMPSSLSWSKEVQQWCRDNQRLLFSYSGSSRLTGGAQFYFNDAIQVMCPWTYTHGDWTGFHQFKDRHPNCFVFPTADRKDVLSTLAWERIREGYDDFRCLYTLEQSARGRPGPVADQAMAFLRDASTRGLSNDDFVGFRDRMLDLLAALAGQDPPALDAAAGDRAK
jgi:hypothetical protein